MIMSAHVVDLHACVIFSFVSTAVLPVLIACSTEATAHDLIPNDLRESTAIKKSKDITTHTITCIASPISHLGLLKLHRPWLPEIPID